MAEGTRRDRRFAAAQRPPKPNPMALVRTVDVTELKPQPREIVVKRPTRERLRASLGERALQKQLERLEGQRRSRGLGSL